MDFQGQFARNVTLTSNLLSIQTVTIPQVSWLVFRSLVGLFCLLVARVSFSCLPKGRNLDIAMIALT